MLQLAEAKILRAGFGGDLSLVLGGSFWPVVFVSF